MEENNDSKEFWVEKESELGKKVLFRSFARFIGETGKGPLNLSGLLFATDERVYFEDFEKSTMLDFFNKKKKKWEKYTMNFLITDASGMRKVSESSAEACINGNIEEAKPQGALGGLFGTPAWEIKFKTGGSYFFELFEPDYLLNTINNQD